MQAEKDPKKAAGACLDSIKLDPELYRLGHTKVNQFKFLKKLISDFPSPGFFENENIHWNVRLMERNLIN